MADITTNGKITSGYEDPNNPGHLGPVADLDEIDGMFVNSLAFDDGTLTFSTTKDRVNAPPVVFNVATFVANALLAQMRFYITTGEELPITFDEWASNNQNTEPLVTVPTFTGNRRIGIAIPLNHKDLTQIILGGRNRISDFNYAPGYSFGVVQGSYHKIYTSKRDLPSADWSGESATLSTDPLYDRIIARRVANNMFTEADFLAGTTFTDPVLTAPTAVGASHIGIWLPNTAPDFTSIQTRLAITQEWLGNAIPKLTRPLTVNNVVGRYWYTVNAQDWPGSGPILYTQP